MLQNGVNPSFARPAENVAACPSAMPTSNTRSGNSLNQVIQIVNAAVKKYPKGRFLFWTLTTKNVFSGKALNKEISKINNAFNLMMKYKKIQKNILGYLKATEVTVNQKDGSYNQHLHVLVFVKANYFSGKEDNYISQAELTESTPLARQTPAITIYVR